MSKFPLYLFNLPFFESPEIVVDSSEKLPTKYRPFGKNFTPENGEDLFKMIVTNRLLPNKGGNITDTSFYNKIKKKGTLENKFYNDYLKDIFKKNGNLPSTIEELDPELTSLSRGKKGSYIDQKKTYTSTEDNLNTNFNDLVVDIGKDIEEPWNDSKINAAVWIAKEIPIFNGWDKKISNEDVKKAEFKALNKLDSSVEPDSDNYFDKFSHIPIQINFPGIFKPFIDDNTNDEGDLELNTIVSIPKGDDFMMSRGKTLFDMDKAINAVKKNSEDLQALSSVFRLTDPERRDDLLRFLDNDQKKYADILFSINDKVNPNRKMSVSDVFDEEANKILANAKNKKEIFSALNSLNRIGGDESETLMNRYEQAREKSLPGEITNIESFLKKLYELNGINPFKDKPFVQAFLQGKTVDVDKRKYFDRSLKEDPNYKKYLDAIVKSSYLDSMGARKMIEAFQTRHKNSDDKYYVDKKIANGLTNSKSAGWFSTIFNVDERSGEVSKKKYDWQDKTGFTYEHVTPIKALSRMINFSKLLRGDDTEKHEEDVKKILDKFYYVAYVSKNKDENLNDILQSDMDDSVYKKLGVKPKDNYKKVGDVLDNLPNLEPIDDNMSADDFIEKIESMPDNIAFDRYGSRIEVVKRDEIFPEDIIKTPHTYDSVVRSNIETREKDNPNIKKKTSFESKKPTLTNMLFGYYG